MDSEAILHALRESHAVLSGHFALTSGRHSDTYMQCARVFEDTNLTNDLARAAAARIPDDLGVDLVASPAVGGLIFGYAVASALGSRYIFAERKDGAMTFRRGFTIAPGARVLIVEDVVTTGGSVKEVAEIVRAAGGEVAGIVSLVDRGGEHGFDVPYFPLMSFGVESWDPDECALCARGIAIEAPGSRALSGASS